MRLCEKKLGTVPAHFKQCVTSLNSHQILNSDSPVICLAWIVFTISFPPRTAAGGPPSGVSCRLITALSNRNISLGDDLPYEWSDSRVNACVAEFYWELVHSPGVTQSCHTELGL